MSTLTCPTCPSQNIIKNSRIPTVKHNHKCKTCGRQHTKALIDKLLLEKNP